MSVPEPKSFGAVRIVETLLFGARWLLAPLYLAMVVLLALLVVRFILELAHAALQLPTMDETHVIMATLSLIDLSLTANLVVLVILTGYENFVARITLAEGDRRPEWMGNIDFGGLKLKLMGSITAIAAVHVLRVFLEVRAEPDRVVMAQGGLMLGFVITGLLLALTDRIAGHG
ncbi:MAG: TIGR00645 family protein [Acidiphilium sp.]|nr:TIGR00645 family protein [Acidiphilium sp.]MDD4934986.1 TIGR00645 family protein [Acidiphilium sp.]